MLNRIMIPKLFQYRTSLSHEEDLSFKYSTHRSLYHLLYQNLVHALLVMIIRNHDNCFKFVLLTWNYLCYLDTTTWKILPLASSHSLVTLHWSRHCCWKDNFFLAFGKIDFTWKVDSKNLKELIFRKLLSLVIKYY